MRWSQGLTDDSSDMRENRCRWCNADITHDGLSLRFAWHPLLFFFGASTFRNPVSIFNDYFAQFFIKYFPNVVMTVRITFTLEPYFKPTEKATTAGGIFKVSFKVSLPLWKYWGKNLVQALLWSELLNLGNLATYTFKKNSPTVGCAHPHQSSAPFWLHKTHVERKSLRINYNVLFTFSIGELHKHTNR